MLALLWLVQGCGRVTAHRRMTENVHVELTPADYEFVKQVDGKSCVGRYLFFFKFYSPNPIEAAGNALRQAPEANWLGNRHVSLQEEIVVPLIYQRECIYLEGEAIKVHTGGRD
jgi:hypothetical protein